MRKINKLLKRSRKFIGDLHNITYLIKVNMNLYVIILLKIWMNRKMNLFFKYQYKMKIDIFLVITN